MGDFGVVLAPLRRFASPSPLPSTGWSSYAEIPVPWKLRRLGWWVPRVQPIGRLGWAHPPRYAPFGLRVNGAQCHWGEPGLVRGVLPQEGPVCFKTQVATFVPALQWIAADGDDQDTQSHDDGLGRIYARSRPLAEFPASSPRNSLLKRRKPCQKESSRNERNTIRRLRGTVLLLRKPRKNM